MSKKIMRIAQDGMLYVNRLNEGDSFSISPNFVEIGGELIEGYPFVKPVIDDSLVLWLDGSTGNNYEKTNIWKDLSGNGNDGKLMNFDFTEDSGWVDGGLKFDGVDDYVDCGNGDSLNITEDLTIEMVVKINPGDNVGGICKGDYGTWIANSYGLRSRYSTNKNDYRFFISDGDKTEGPSFINIDTGSWLHLIGTTSKAEMDFKLYRDGILYREEQRTIEDILITNNKLEIGTYHRRARTQGAFKFIRIYNRALTDEEILQNYQAGQCSPLLAMRGDIIG